MRSCACRAAGRSSDYGVAVRLSGRSVVGRSRPDFRDRRRRFHEDHALNSNFSGFNDEVVFPAEYFDYRLNNIAAQLPRMGALPQRQLSEAFDWRTG